MVRFISVWLPAWPIERLRRALLRAGKSLPWHDGDRRELPFALVESGVHGLTLTAVNTAAWREGLRPGRTLADARAAFPALLTHPAQVERDAAALLALAGWAGRYGPRRHVEGADGLWVDISGVAHLFGGEAALAADLRSRLARSSLEARIGLADTPGAAFALARFATTPRAPCRIAEAGQSATALALLPVDALRLPADAVQLLKRLGLRRIGQLYDLPRDALAQRFRSGAGPRTLSRKREREALLVAGTVLMRLDQALGRTPEPREPLEEPPVHRVERLFAEPLISADGVGVAIETLARDLQQRLAARCEGGLRFTLGIYRADSSAQHITIGASRPCRNAGHIVTLLAEKIATIDAGFGIDAITLAAADVAPIDDAQITLAGAGAMATAEAEALLVDRLSNRLGATRVHRLAPAPSHIPEAAERRVPALLERKPDPPPPLTPQKSRPPLLLPTPEPILVLAEVPEGPPLRFSWRRITRAIVRAQGPERIAPEWWRQIGRSPSAAPRIARNLTRTRDYYRIEDEDGGRYWVFRAGLYARCEEEELAEEVGDQDDVPQASAPVWFLHGVFA